MSMRKSRMEIQGCKCARRERCMAVCSKEKRREKRVRWKSCNDFTGKYHACDGRNEASVRNVRESTVVMDARVKTSTGLEIVKGNIGGHDLH